MSCNVQRILVYLKKSKDKQETLARFSQCILKYFGADGPTTQLHAEITNNSLLVTDDLGGNTPVKIKHPAFCPILHLSHQDEAALPPDIAERGIDVGAAIILETGDGKVLLTRRAKHLRAFPGIWVPPGGHIEANETFVEAGLREYEEETGLHIEAGQCIGHQLQVLALWESVYPPKLSFGPPKRHHVVVYLYGKLTSDLTSERLRGQLKMQPEEVDACVWVDRKVAAAIVTMSEEDASQHSAVPDDLPKCLSAVKLDEKKQQVDFDLDLTPLLQRSGDTEEKERVSTGTKFALSEWLQRGGT